MEQGAFARVKAAVSALDIWRRYGGGPVRGGYVNCVFHNDRSPSMRLYEGDRGYYCFACGAGGDAVKLAGALLELSPLEAVKRVGADFGLNLPDGKPSRSAMRAVNRRRQREQAFESWQWNAERTLADYHRLLRQAKSEKAPQTPEDNIDPLFTEACHGLDYAVYALEWLGNDPMGFYRANRNYIEKVVKRLGNI
jgi:hypothetical protein